MKTVLVFFKYYLALFLIVCLGVHVYGLYSHYGHETTESHITHLLSYSLCLLAVLVKLRNRFFVYLFASVYPWVYHANCAWVSFIELGKFNWICIYVVIMMPLGLLWILNEPRNKLV